MLHQEEQQAGTGAAAWGNDTEGPASIGGGRGGGEGGIADNSLSREFTARLNAIVEELTRCAQDLREVTEAASQGEGCADGTFPNRQDETEPENTEAETGSKPEGGEDNNKDDHDEDDDDEVADVAAVEATLEAAAALRKATRAGTTTSLAGGDGGDDQGTVASPPPPPPPSRTRGAAHAYMFPAGAQIGDWRERVPATPPAGHARTYPSKPERARFQLPTALNQRGAPRSLVEWYMTRVYDPVQVTERAQRLAEQRETKRQNGSLAGSASSEDAGDDSASEYMSDTSAETVVATEAATTTTITTRASTPRCTTPALSESGTSVDHYSVQSCADFLTNAYVEARLPSEAQFPPRPPSQPQQQVRSERERNRAHVMGSSLLLGGNDAPPAHRRSLTQHNCVDARSSRSRPGSAGTTETGSTETLWEMSDASARERERIRRKVLGGGVRPDWFAVPEEAQPSPGAYTSPSTPSPPIPPSSTIASAPQGVHEDSQLTKAPVEFASPLNHQHPALTIPGNAGQNLNYWVPEQETYGNGATMECGTYAKHQTNASVQLIQQRSQTQLVQNTSLPPTYLEQLHSKQDTPETADSRESEELSVHLTDKRRPSTPQCVANDVYESMSHRPPESMEKEETTHGSAKEASEADAWPPRRKTTAKKRKPKGDQQIAQGARGSGAGDAHSEEALRPAAPASGQRDTLAKTTSSARAFVANALLTTAASRSRCVAESTSGTIRRMTQRARYLRATPAPDGDRAAAPRFPLLDSPAPSTRPTAEVPRRSASSDKHAPSSELRLAADTAMEAPLAAGDVAVGESGAARRPRGAGGRAPLRAMVSSAEVSLLRHLTAKSKKSSMSLAKRRADTKPQPPLRESTFSLSSTHSVTRH